ncbi:MAG: hypothetical protein AAF914_11470 [Pseudomonadota bacterium]
MRGVWVAVFVFAASAAAANPVTDACLAAGRAADPALCSCIGAAATITLSERDQRRAAGFFRDPQAAQDMRRSDRSQDERFWQRYVSFTQIAEDLCS